MDDEARGRLGAQRTYENIAAPGPRLSSAAKDLFRFALTSHAQEGRRARAKSAVDSESGSLRRGPRVLSSRKRHLKNCRKTLPARPQSIAFIFISRRSDFGPQCRRPQSVHLVTGLRSHATAAFPEDEVWKRLSKRKSGTNRSSAPCRIAQAAYVRIILTPEPVADEVCSLDLTKSCGRSPYGKQLQSRAGALPFLKPPLVRLDQRRAKRMLPAPQDRADPLLVRMCRCVQAG